MATRACAPDWLLRSCLRRFAFLLALRGLSHMIKERHCSPYSRYSAIAVYSVFANLLSPQFTNAMVLVRWY